MPHKKKFSKHRQNKNKLIHSDGVKKYSAMKELHRQTKRQAEHQERGKVGHYPVKRKIIK